MSNKPDAQPTATPAATPATATVAVDLEKLGVKSVEELNKLVASSLKARDYTAKADKADRDAKTALKKAHLPEFTNLLNAERAKAGLPPAK